MQRSGKEFSSSEVTVSNESSSITTIEGSEKRPVNRESSGSQESPTAPINALPSFATLTANLNNQRTTYSVGNLDARTSGVNALNKGNPFGTSSSIGSHPYSLLNTASSFAPSSQNTFASNQTQMPGFPTPQISTFPAAGGKAVESSSSAPIKNNNNGIPPGMRPILPVPMHRAFDDHRGSTSSMSSGSIPSPYIPFNSSSIPATLLQRMSMNASSSPILPARNSFHVTLDTLRLSQAEELRRRSEEEKRLMHTISERNRRKTVNDSFANLKRVLPDFADVEKPIKMEVLKNARHYIVSLTQETESLEKELRFLMDQAEDLGLDPQEIMKSLEANERIADAAKAARDELNETADYDEDNLGESSIGGSVGTGSESASPPQKSSVASNPNHRNSDTVALNDNYGSNYNKGDRKRSRDMRSSPIEEQGEQEEENYGEQEEEEELELELEADRESKNEANEDIKSRPPSYPNSNRKKRASMY